MKMPKCRTLAELNEYKVDVDKAKQRERRYNRRMDAWTILFGVLQFLIYAVVWLSR